MSTCSEGFWILAVLGCHGHQRLVIDTCYWLPLELVAHNYPGVDLGMLKGLSGDP